MWQVTDNFSFPSQKDDQAYFVLGEGVYVKCSVLPDHYGNTPDQIQESRERALANANMIAAADDMLEALKQIANTSSDASTVALAQLTIKKAQP